MKPMRHKMILQILQKETVETQEELAERLREHGIDATQATISRDIKELKLQKTLTDNGRYRYQAPAKIFEPELDTRLRNIFKESVVSADRAKNIIVLRTLPGLAPAACSAIDAMQLDEIVGTLAGDDTAIVILREDNHAVDFSEKISDLLR
ncbi:MAG: arginine repressor [Clostridiales bacterium]|jgi:transcriptional regulator of arginine metabolism|nr:arginine repressor [Clostridiales bacterium]